MPKCVGYKNDFKAQGFPAHKKSCKLYKCKLKAQLTNVLDSGLIAGPSNKTEDPGELGTGDDMLVDEYEVLLVHTGQICRFKKKLILLLIQEPERVPTPPQEYQKSGLPHHKMKLPKQFQDILPPHPCKGDCGAELNQILAGGPKRIGWSFC